MVEEDDSVVCDGGEVEDIKNSYWSVKSLSRIDENCWIRSGGCGIRGVREGIRR